MSTDPLRARLGSLLRRVRGRLAGRSAGRHALVGRPELWAMKRSFQIEFLRSRGLEPRHSLLDIGCGTLRGGLPIIDYLDEGNYFGIEARASALEEAGRELEEAALAHKRPTLLLADDFAKVQLDRPMDYAWAFSVLIHFDDVVLESCLRAVARWLDRDGSFLANVNVGERTTQRWERFPVVSRSLGFYAERAAQLGLVVEDLGELRALGHLSGIDRQDRQRMLLLRRR